MLNLRMSWKSIITTVCCTTTTVEEWNSLYFAGVFPSDRLPARPVEEGPRGYIVNIDTHDQLGSHWVALWTHDGGCTVMDSFAIPLAMYKPHDLLDWLTHHFQGFESNGIVSNSFAKQIMSPFDC